MNPIDVSYIHGLKLKECPFFSLVDKYYHRFAIQGYGYYLHFAVGSLLFLGEFRGLNNNKIKWGRRDGEQGRGSKNGSREGERMKVGGRRRDKGRGGKEEREDGRKGRERKKGMQGEKGKREGKWEVKDNKIKLNNLYTPGFRFHYIEFHENLMVRTQRYGLTNKLRFPSGQKNILPTR